MLLNHQGMIKNLLANPEPLDGIAVFTHVTYTYYADMYTPKDTTQEIADLSTIGSTSLYETTAFIRICFGYVLKYYVS